MKNLSKLQKLKNWNLSIVDSVIGSGAIDNYEYGYVGPTGLTRSDLRDKLEKMRKCANLVELRQGANDTEPTIHNANFCQCPTVCPVCSARLQITRMARFLKPGAGPDGPIQTCAKNYKYAYMVTFTVAPGADLTDQLKSLKSGLRAWMRKGQRRGNGRSRGEFGKVRAGVLNYEVKRGRGFGAYHVHAHALFFTDEKIDIEVYDSEKKAALARIYGEAIPKKILATAAKESVWLNGKLHPVSKLSREWLSATGNSINIDCRMIRRIPKGSSGAKLERFRAMTWPQSVAAQSVEVLKYSSKLNGNSGADVLDIMDRTHGFRLFASYGALRDAGKNDEYEAAAAPGGISYLVEFDPQTNTYSGMVAGSLESRSIRDHIKAEFRRQTAILQGVYRKLRNRAIGEYGAAPGRVCLPLARTLDNLKNGYRGQVAALWGKYYNGLANLLELSADAARAEIENVGRQLCLGFGDFALKSQV